jgi:hypothetical protein
MIGQRELAGPGPLLRDDGSLADIGWARQPILDCNLEKARFYSTFRFWQKFRIKVWDYYGITTPTHFISFTLGNVGYLGSIFAYVIDFATGQYHEATLTIPLATGISLPRNSKEGVSLYDNGKYYLKFTALPESRKLEVRWPDFLDGALNADVELKLPTDEECMTIVIPIKGKRFYYNRKVNCMPASGSVEYRGSRLVMDPAACLGSLDWGRGVWEYNSYWVWASASGFLKDKRRIGLNMGYGFGDTSQAGENCFILDGKVHKLGEVDFTFSSQNYKAPWHMQSGDGRLDLQFTPFVERVAKTNAVILSSEVHQMFGRYNGTLITDEGKKLEVKDLIGWAEEHHAKW